MKKHLTRKILAAALALTLLASTGAGAFAANCGMAFIRLRPEAASWDS